MAAAQNTAVDEASFSLNLDILFDENNVQRNLDTEDIPDSDLIQLM